MVSIERTSVPSSGFTLNCEFCIEEAGFCLFNKSIIDKDLSADQFNRRINNVSCCFYEIFVNKNRPMGVSSKSEVCCNLCQCNVNHVSSKSTSSKVSSDNLFSPIKNKMKIMKKIKKKMGLGRLNKAINYSA